MATETTTEARLQALWDRLLKDFPMPSIVNAITGPRLDEFLEELKRQEKLVSAIPLAHGEAEIPSEYVCIQVGK